MHLSNKHQRQVVRLIHLLIGSALGFLVYAPASLTEGLRLVMQVGVLPILVLSGLWLWYGTRLLKYLRASSVLSTSSTRLSSASASHQEWNIAEK